MPLKKPRKGATKKQRQKVASKNIAAEMKAGRPRKQAIAIGLSTAGLARKRKKRK